MIDIKLGAAPVIAIFRGETLIYGDMTPPSPSPQSLTIETAPVLIQGQPITIGVTA